MKSRLYCSAAAILIPTAAMSQSSFPTLSVQDVLFTAFQLTGSTVQPPNSMVLQFESEVNAYDYSSSPSGFVACGSASDVTGTPDDSSCLNAWLSSVGDSLTIAPGQLIYARLPPARRSSGWYDICTGVTIPDTYGYTIYIFGGAKLRVPPYCTTQPTSMITAGSVTPAPGPPGPQDNDKTMLYISDLTLDGMGLPEFDLTIDHTNTILHNVHARNAAGETSLFGSLRATQSAPLYVEGGGQIFIDGSNRFECVNDSSLTILYSSTGTTQNIPGVTSITACTYDIWFSAGHDSKVSDVVVIGAGFANIADSAGKGNSWIHPQTYNYNNVTDLSHTDMEAYQGILVDDHAHLLLNAYVGQTTNLGVHVSHNTGTPTANQNLLVLGGDVIGPGSNATTYSEIGIDAGALVSVTDFQFQTPSNCATIMANSTGTTLAGTSVFSDNNNCAFTWGSNALSVGALTVNGVATFPSLSTGSVAHTLCVTSTGKLVTC
jgi:hypothetical protein